MQHSIEHSPSFAWLRVQLDAGDRIQTEAGSMVTMTPGLPMSTRLNAGTGGFLRKIWAFLVALMRKIFGGESIFVNEFGGTTGGEVVLAPALAGDIRHMQLKPGSAPLMVQGGSYLASTGDIDTKMQFAGLRGLLGGEGLFFLRCEGNGDLFLNAYGGIHPVQCNGKYVVDTGHIVAFSGDLNYKVKTPGGGVTGFLGSGEGLVMEFEGQGTIWIQSRNLGALVGWITPMLPN